MAMQDEYALHRLNLLEERNFAEENGISFDVGISSEDGETIKPYLFIQNDQGRGQRTYNAIPSSTLAGRSSMRPH